MGRPVVVDLIGVMLRGPPYLERMPERINLAANANARHFLAAKIAYVIILL